MEDGVFTNQGKKLLFVALFLVLVAMLVGGEEDPGMIAQIGDNNVVAAPQAYAPPAVEAHEAPVVRAPRRIDRPERNDASLEDWYAEAAPAEPVDPQPVDESYLINDAQPIVSAEPQTEMVN